MRPESNAGVMLITAIGYTLLVVGIAATLLWRFL